MQPASVARPVVSPATIPAPSPVASPEEVRDHQPPHTVRPSLAHLERRAGQGNSTGTDLHTSARWANSTWADLHTSAPSVGSTGTDLHVSSPARGPQLTAERLPHEGLMRCKGEAPDGDVWSFGGYEGREPFLLYHGETCVAGMAM